MVKRQRTIPMPSAAKYARLITAPKAALAAAQLQKLKKDVRRLKQKVETKELSSDTSLTPTTTVQALATGIQPWRIVQGVTATNRLGDEVVMTRLRMEAFLTASVAQEVKIVLVLDKQCGGAVITPSQVFDSNTAGQQAFMTGTRNADFLDRYVILATRHLVFDLGTGLNKRVFIDVKRRIPFKFKGNAGAITDLSGANIQLLYQSQGSTSTCTGPWNGSIEWEDE